MKKSIYDVYRVWAGDERVNSECVVGGYKDLMDAVIIARRVDIFWTKSANTRPVLFTVRPCIHKDTIEMRDRHTAPIDDETLQKLTIGYVNA